MAAIHHEFGNPHANINNSRPSRKMIKELSATLLSHLPPPIEPQEDTGTSAKTASSRKKKRMGKTLEPDRDACEDDTFMFSALYLFFGEGPIRSSTVHQRLSFLFTNISEGKVYNNFNDLYWNIMDAQPCKSKGLTVMQRVFCLAPSRRTKYKFELEARSLQDLCCSMDGAAKKEAAQPEQAGAGRKESNEQEKGLPKAGQDQEEGDLTAVTADNETANEEDDEIFISLPPSETNAALRLLCLSNDGTL